MSLEKTKTVDQIVVTENGVVLVREVTRVTDDGLVISETYRRASFAPGDDVSAQPMNVQVICGAAWTPEVVVAYQASAASVTF